MTTSSIILRQFALTLFLGVLVSAGCSKPAAEPSWVSFSTPAGMFSAMMPSKPDEVVNKTPTGEEAHTFSIVSALSNLKAISVSYVERPTAVQGGADKLLDLARDTAAANLDGRVLSEKPITLGSFPGREIKLALPKGNVVKERIFLAHNRQYTAMVITAPANANAPEVSRFFDSFKIEP